MQVERHLESSIRISADPAAIWEQITNVRIEQFSEPWYFRFLDIPKPLSAEVQSEGVGGSRIAYFKNKKRFIQKITAWDRPSHYAFTFNPEEGFRVGYVFDLANGVFRILTGSYRLVQASNGVTLTLDTTYSIRRSAMTLLAVPIRLVLIVFQKYLLSSIKKNSELSNK